MTLLLTSRPPSSFVFVNAAVFVAFSAIVPVSPVFVVTKPAAVSSDTAYA